LLQVKEHVIFKLLKVLSGEVTLADTANDPDSAPFIAAYQQSTPC